MYRLCVCVWNVTSTYVFWKILSASPRNWCDILEVPFDWNSTLCLCTVWRKWQIKNTSRPSLQLYKVGKGIPQGNICATMFKYVVARISLKLLLHICTFTNVVIERVFVKEIILAWIAMHRIDDLLQHRICMLVRRVIPNVIHMLTFSFIIKSSSSSILLYDPWTKCPEIVMVIPQSAWKRHFSH